MRFSSAIVLFACSALGWGSTFVVTSPADGDYLGRSNRMGFTVTGAEREVRVSVRATSLDTPDDVITFREATFQPDADGRVTGNIDINFDEATPEGSYRLDITPREEGATFDPVPSITVNVDVRNPRFRNTNPLTGSFVRGVVPIRAELEEANIQEWRVQINGRDIPNNSGSTETLLVNWNTDTVRDDGSQSISIRVEDKAKNSASRTISVTLDRVAPSSTILTPGPNDQIRPNSNIAVAVEVVDQHGNSMHASGVDVVIRDGAGNYIGRVARRTVNVSGTRLTWSGRIQRDRRLPSTFQIEVSAVDRAGNRAVVQRVNLRIGR